uniref:Peptidase n=1 Tax=viral metagenome TaxID=1070528 RepID=A0A6M3L8T9_9ZZZZ
MRSHFDIKEVVCPHVFEKLGEGAWRLFDPRLIQVMTWLRLSFDRPIWINDCENHLTQRGLRCNRCTLSRDNAIANVTYLSAHVFGAAFDFDVEGMEADQVRDWIWAHNGEVPHPIRLELYVSWVHLDVLTEGKMKITNFNP